MIVQVMMNLVILLLCYKILWNIWYNRSKLIVINLGQTQKHKLMWTESIRPSTRQWNWTQNLTQIDTSFFKTHKKQTLFMTLVSTCNDTSNTRNSVLSHWLIAMIQKYPEWSFNCSLLIGFRSFLCNQTLQTHQFSIYGQRLTIDHM